MIIKRCIPKSKQGKILQECHASPYGGHFAGDKTATKFSNQVFIGLLLSRIVLNG